METERPAREEQVINCGGGPDPSDERITDVLMNIERNAKEKE